VIRFVGETPVTRKELHRIEVPSADPRSDFRRGTECEKNYASLSRQFAASADRRFEFHKRGQLFIRVHNETLSVVAVCVSNPDRSPIGINRCDAAPPPTGFAKVVTMISQYFTAAICPMRRAVRLWLVFPGPADARDMSENHDHPAAVFACRRFAQVPNSQVTRSSRVRLR
jgi:hypothetical protein